MTKKILTIAGSDSISGGGIQADLATFSQYGHFSFTAITSIVTIVDGEFVIHEVDAEILEQELRTIFSIAEIDTIKIGLLPSVKIIKIVSSFLKDHANIPIIVDPVLVFKEKNEINLTKIINTMVEEIFPYATIITPNLDEARLLSGIEQINTVEDMKIVSEKLIEMGAKSVVIKGGSRINGQIAVDVLNNKNQLSIFESKKINSNNNNGAGCTFASAIASNVINGSTLEFAVKDAKDFVYKGIEHGITLSDDIGNVFQGARGKYGR
jgi:pyridoxine kinase